MIFGIIGYCALILCDYIPDFVDCQVKNALKILFAMRVQDLTMIPQAFAFLNSMYRISSNKHRT